MDLSQLNKEQLEWLDQAIISTDDEEMKNEGIKFGLDAPFTRPAELATDGASALDVWKHALIESENYYNISFDITDSEFVSGIVLNNNSPVTVTASDATVYFTAAGELSGNIDLQGRTAEGQTVTVDVCPVGSYTASFGGSVTLGSGGSYSVTNIDAGRYTVIVSKDGYLSQTADNVKVVPFTTTWKHFTDDDQLLGGDVTGWTASDGTTTYPNNIIETDDATAIVAAFATISTDDDWNAYADVDNSGTVYVDDLNYAALNRHGGNETGEGPTYKRSEANNQNALIALNLVDESFDYVYGHIKPSVQLGSISGGTDLISCFALASPVLPVYRGELQCRGLGMDVDAFDEDGNSVINKKGELVCKSPFPSMPVFFWNDKDGEKYRKAYFDKYPNVWAHGDFIEINERGGLKIFGRSDATLNPGGIRIGTAEIYRVVEAFNEVGDSLVIGQEWKGDQRMILFLKLSDSYQINDDLIQQIKQSIRASCSPRHVPEIILPTEDIPYTISGKKVEIAVKKIIDGEDVANRDALANPESLDLYISIPELA